MCCAAFGAGHTLAAGACWASGWRDYLTDHVNRMGNITGLSMIETDGPYGGCVANNHMVKCSHRGRMHVVECRQMAWVGPLILFAPPRTRPTPWGVAAARRKTPSWPPLMQVAHGVGQVLVLERVARAPPRGGRLRLHAGQPLGGKPGLPIATHAILPHAHVWKGVR